MSSSAETRSHSAMFKRAKQLEHWNESDTHRASTEPRTSSKLIRVAGRRQIQFTDGCVFLAACAAGDKDEVLRLVKRGADIDTANVDGLTALHQACIDDNLDMVEFLVKYGADVNRGDNEGWTPLHATASCGFLSIARYLLEQKADVAAVNNDGELAIDISESDEMEELLQKEIDSAGIDCEESRHMEERMMLADAMQWRNANSLGDTPHAKTGATALHVAAAKGYVRVMNLVIQCGAAVNVQDHDGWTPLHAAAHWGQREACELLCENYANMDVKNYVGQTCFDVADPDVSTVLDDLKKRQATLSSGRPDIRKLINTPAVPAISQQNSAKRSNNNFNNANNVTNNLNANQNDNDRSSITRISLEDKDLRSKEVSKQERDILVNKAGILAETIQESAAHRHGSDSDSDTAKRNRANHLDLGIPKIVTTPSKEDSGGGGAASSDRSSPPDGKKSKTFNATDNEEVHPWRVGSLRSRPGISSTIAKLSPSKEEDDVQLRRVHSFESDEKFYARLTELRNRIRANSMELLTTASEDEATSKTKVSKSNNTPLSSSDLSKSSNIYGSLPRVANASRHLPTLPETGPLVRSISLKDNSAAAANNDDAVNPPSTNKPRPVPAASAHHNQSHLSKSPQQSVLRRVNSAGAPTSPLITTTPLITDLMKPPLTTSSFSSSTSATETTPILTKTNNNDDAGVFKVPPTPPKTLDLWKRRGDDTSPRPKGDTKLNQPLRHPPPSGAEVIRSHVPPVRDDESETQRKAHAKLVRQTRRSTQGVTLEDLKSAEKLVKSRNNESSQYQTQSNTISNSASPSSVSSPFSTGATTIATATATLVAGSAASPSAATGATSPSGDMGDPMRRPSWRLKEVDRVKFRLETDLSPSKNLDIKEALAALKTRGSSKPSTPTSTVPSISLPDTPNSASSSPKPSSKAKKAKKAGRRLTGVVNVNDLGDDDDDDEDEDEAFAHRKNLADAVRPASGGVVVTPGATAPGSTATTPTHGATGGIGDSRGKSQNGDVDYKKLWEESQKQNSRLREDNDRMRDDLSHATRQLDKSKAQNQASSSGGLSDQEKREKKALEKKLLEMEEELRQIPKLKAENERLKSENRALTRVVAKLTAAGSVPKIPSGLAASATSPTSSLASNSSGVSGGSAGVGGGPAGILKKRPTNNNTTNAS